MTSNGTFHSRGQQRKQRRNRTNNKKRSHRPQQLFDQLQPEQVVDDLAHAASFALMPTADVVTASATTSHQTTFSADEADDEQSDSSQDHTNDESSISSDSSGDDESVIDIEDVHPPDHDQDEYNKKSSSRPPKTQHEIDPYLLPCPCLSTTNNNNNDKHENAVLELAGKIKCLHLGSAAHPPTLVIESAREGQPPLEEGSLLLLQQQTTSATSPILPLGTVFEVFGPVRRPLYTLRLPSTKSTNPDNNEIRISEEEEQLNHNHLLPAKNNATKRKLESTVSADEEPETTGPWSQTGIYTKLLQKHQQQQIQVYYLPRQSRVLDPLKIRQACGKGCDASNLYDEEVTDPNEMYFSDDETERHYRSRRNKPSTKTKNSNDSLSEQERPSYSPTDRRHPHWQPPSKSSSSSSSAHHQHPSMHPFQQQTLPPGFHSSSIPSNAYHSCHHHPATHDAAAQPPTSHAYHPSQLRQQHLFHPSPPPKIPQQQQPCSNTTLRHDRQREAHSYQHQQAPNQPESDTVYYDF